ncbi:hypothetical protein CEXT_729501 [Caerostris extrusa]|uniref:Uncharacterized protein n=1 Tax=Caerostris extrusa TaxID=172846 RepID=A0AAV4WPD5_CAEEX|nr:hypothetical protein CEXT_729501 [Caerostris extrusa]
MNNRQAWRRKALHAVVGTARQTHPNKRIPQNKRKIRDKDSRNKVDDIVWHTVVIACSLGLKSVFSFRVVEKANGMNNRQAWRRKTLHGVMGTTRQTHPNTRIPQKKR